MTSKRDIIAEIVRTAKSNGSNPLGAARFEKETGITNYVWGQYWARFGDAQKDAGFEPNKFQGAHPDEFLIDRLIAVIRKLGRYPTFREIDVERHNDQLLPTKTVFQRLGSKENVAQKVIAYCADREGFEDIVAACSAVSGIADRKERPAGDVPEDIGEVYLFKSGKYFKIGRTNDAVRRGSEIRIQLPEKVTLIHSIKTDDPPGVETYWHRRFERKRMKGEWFDLSPAEVKAFRRWRRIS